VIKIDQRNDHHYRIIFIYKKHTLIMNFVSKIRKRTDGGLYTSLKPEVAELYDIPEGSIIEFEIKTIKRPEVD